MSPIFSGNFPRIPSIWRVEFRWRNWHTIIAQAKLYIGPDTGITHLAAATGIPVIALYGPTNPVKWAPWPSGYKQNITLFIK